MPAEQKPASVFSPAFKVINTVGIVLLVVLATSFVFKDSIIRFTAEKAGSSVLGARISIGWFSWDIAASRVTARKIMIDHPPGYEKGDFVNIPEVTVKYNPKKLSHGEWHIPLVLIDIKEMMVIKSKEGKLNIDSLKVLHPEKNVKSTVPPFKIDELKLNVGRVIYKDYSVKKLEPNILVYNINFKNKAIKDIDSVPKLVGSVIVQAVKNTALQGAGIYAAAAVMGVGFLPGAVLGVVVSKDSVTQDFDKGYDQVFAACEKFLTERGKLGKADKTIGLIVGKVDGADIKIRLEKISWFKTKVTVSARKFMLAKREFAGGVLYQIAEKLL